MVYRFKMSLEEAVNGYLSTKGSEKDYYRSVIKEKLFETGKATTENYEVSIYYGYGTREQIKIKGRQTR